MLFSFFACLCLSCSESDEVFNDYCVIKADELKKDSEFEDADNAKLAEWCVEYLKKLPACKSKYKSYTQCVVEHHDEIIQKEQEFSQALDELMSGDSYDGEKADELKEEYMKKIPCKDKESNYQTCMNEEDKFKNYPALPEYVYNKHLDSL